MLGPAAERKAAGDEVIANARFVHDEAVQGRYAKVLALARDVEVMKVVEEKVVKVVVGFSGVAAAVAPVQELQHGSGVLLACARLVVELHQEPNPIRTLATAHRQGCPQSGSRTDGGGVQLQGREQQAHEDDEVEEGKTNDL